MLRNRGLAFIPKHFKIKSRAKYPARYINCIRQDSNGFEKLTFSRFPRFLIHSRLQHTDLKLELKEDQEKFFEILTKFEENHDVSIHSIKTTVHILLKSLSDIALEEQHEKKIQQSSSFLKLVKAVEFLIHEMEVNEIVKFLDLCNKLHMVHKISVISTALRKVKDDSKSLTLANKIKFTLLLNNELMVIDKQLVLELRKCFMMETEMAIKNKSYRKSPDDIIAALITLPLLKFLSVDDKIHVLYSVLDLKNWNDGLVFKSFLKVNLPVEHPLTEDVREKFLERMEKEISGNNKYLSDFLVGFSKNMNISFVDYDQDLIDAAINQILKNDLSTQQIRKICASLSQMDHCSYEFVEYSINFLKKNPNIFSSHPAISAHIIETMADSNCNYNEKNRWRSLLPVIRNTSNLPYVLESCRKNSISTYLYFLSKLASLGIFVDDELTFLTVDLNRNKEYFSSWKNRMVILNLNSAVKVLHPNFSKPILNDSHLSLIMNKMSSVHKESRNSLVRLDLLTEIGKCLESSSGVSDCILLNCINKSGFVFDGIIGINRAGKLFDFKTTFEETKKVFIEDVQLPKDYDLVSLHLATEGEHSRNTWDLKATSFLRLQIMEGLGFKTVIFYESLWKNLSDEEKKQYLCMLQG